MFVRQCSNICISYILYSNVFKSYKLFSKVYSISFSSKISNSVALCAFINLGQLNEDLIEDWNASLGFRLKVQCSVFKKNTVRLMLELNKNMLFLQISFILY